MRVESTLLGINSQVLTSQGSQKNGSERINSRRFRIDPPTKSEEDVFAESVNELQYSQSTVIQTILEMIINA